jgi:CheY-like chemotaxis protein
MYSRDLFEICDGNHIMLICQNDKARLDAAAHFINEGLENHQFCIYASVHAFDSESELGPSSLAARVTDYDMNVKDGNLMLLDFKPFYEAATVSNLFPFILLKDKLESILQERVSRGLNDKIMVYADAACCLTEHKEFQESTTLENWWQQTHYEWIKNGKKITVICPHPADILRQELKVKWDIADGHDIMIFLNSHLAGSSKKGLGKDNRLSILVAESEPDIMILYSDYLTRLGHDVSVVTDSNKCISLFRRRDFDLVILDTHLEGNVRISKIAKEIMRIEPHQRTLVTSTNPPSLVSNILGNVSVAENQILQKPFHLSKLINFINQTPIKN